jgi:hypothetical protein
MQQHTKMNDKTLPDLISEIKKDFGPKCSKFAGAICVELLRERLGRHGIITSNRDVFINGVPVEIDLLIPKPGAVPRHGLLYEPGDVLAAFEVKNSGSFGESTILKTRSSFAKIKSKHKSIYCAYIAIAERHNYRWRVTEENLGSPVYTLFWHNGGVNRTYEASGDWSRLIADLKHHVLRPPKRVTRLRITSPTLPRPTL